MKQAAAKVTCNTLCDHRTVSSLVSLSRVSRDQPDLVEYVSVSLKVSLALPRFNQLSKSRQTNKRRAEGVLLFFL